MPMSKEFIIRMKDRPGTLGKFCQALADHGVNILAFQSNRLEKKSLVHLLVDNPATAKAVLDGEHLSYKEVAVAHVKLSHRPGELARAASRLGDAKINIKYAYVGLEPGTNLPLVVFGVADVARAVKTLDETAAAAAAGA